jgi:hypothetical protein
LTTIRLLDEEHDGFFVQTAYRYPTKPVPPGAVVDARDMEPLRGLPVKAMIVAPADGSGVSLGRVRIAGFAWAGEADVARVDVSADGGRTWKQARLGAERAPYAWRGFEYQSQVRRPGAHEFLVRATDDKGRAQPSVPQWNPSGYLWNAIDRVRVVAGATSSSVEPLAPPERDLPIDSATALVKQKCLACHDADLITQQRLTEAGWSRELDKMIRWGADVPDGDRDRLLEFLARHFPAR